MIEITPVSKKQTAPGADSGRPGNNRITRSQYFGGNAKTSNDTNPCRNKNSDITTNSMRKNINLGNTNPSNNKISGNVTSGGINKNYRSANSGNSRSNNKPDDQNKSGNESGESLLWSSPENIVEMVDSDVEMEQRRNHRAHYRQPENTQRTRAAANMCRRDRKSFFLFFFFLRYRNISTFL